MNMELDFNFGGISTTIQCNSQDKLDDIFKRYASKTEVNKEELFFLYGGQTLNGI